MNKRWEYQTAPEKEDSKHPNQKDRNDAILWAIQKLNEGNFVILDTETTGTAEDDQILQIGIVSSTGDCIYSGLVKPIGVQGFDAAAVAVHGISFDMVKNAPTLDEIIEEVSRKVSGRTVLAYNSAFDKRLIRQSCSRAKVPTPNWNWECVMLQYSKFIGEPGRYNGEYKWQKLPRTDVKQAHDATADCLLTLRVLEKMALAKAHAAQKN
jgi:DNA polymerase III epsilon subunit-like protein